MQHLCDTRSIHTITPHGRHRRPIDPHAKAVVDGRLAAGTNIALLNKTPSVRTGLLERTPPQTLGGLLYVFIGQLVVLIIVYRALEAISIEVVSHKGPPCASTSTYNLPQTPAEPQ